MKLRKSILQVTAVLAGAGLCASLYVVWDTRRKDKLTALLIEELNKLFSPTTTGLSAEEAFDVYYAEELSKKIKGIVLIKPDVAARYAKDIYDSWGIIDDDEDKVYGVFRNLKDKVQVSQVARAYKDAYKVNLIDKLRAKLTDNETNQVLKIVNALPRYRAV